MLVFIHDNTALLQKLAKEKVRATILDIHNLEVIVEVSVGDSQNPAGNSDQPINGVLSRYGHTRQLQSGMQPHTPHCAVWSPCEH